MPADYFTKIREQFARRRAYVKSNQDIREKNRSYWQENKVRLNANRRAAVLRNKPDKKRKAAA